MKFLLSCFVVPFVWLMMINSPQKAMAIPTLGRSTDHEDGACPTSPEHSPEGRDGGNECRDVWTFEENKRFENALAMLPGKIDLSLLRGFVEEIAPEFPGKSAEQLGRHLEALWHDVELIESDQVMFPEQWTMEEEDERGREDLDGRPPPPPPPPTRKAKAERKRGIAWTKEEHERFLGGLDMYGKGDWKNIAREVVLTKSPTQVASHAQKYFNRKDRTEKEKLRRSINDTHSVSSTGAVAPDLLSSPSDHYADRK